jgi:Domain of unknown function (DUF3825)
VTLHESKHAGYTDLSRLHQNYLGETDAFQPGGPPPSSPAAPGLVAPPSMPPAVPPVAPSVVPAAAPPAASRPAARLFQRALYKHADLGPLRSDPDRRPPAGEDDCFEQLARLTEPESWSGPASARHDGPGSAGYDELRVLRVLREYIEWTFERLHQQRQVLTSLDGAYSLFNTGLATPQQETVYGLFVPNRNPDGAPWQLAGWYSESDRRLLDHIPELPGFAAYTDSPGDFVYDWRRELTVNPKHLLESQESLGCLPDPLRSNPYQASLVLEGAVRRAEARVRRSYRVAVPCWDPAAERVALLLPLSLTTPETVDVALMVSLEGDTYRGTMVLGLDVAYVRARLIARPEEWLRAT